MTVKVTVELPEEVVARARVVAERTRRRFEDVLADWIDQAGTEPVVELLPDDELLAVCDAELTPACQDELSDLLERNREGELMSDQRSRLDELMRAYRRGLARKARALKAAVARGLKPQLQ